MGYTIFAGCDHGSDIWQTAVQLSALRDSLGEKGGAEAGQPSVVCCASISTPAGSPLVKIVENATDGSMGEVVAGGQTDTFYSIDEIEEQLKCPATPSAPSKVPEAATPPAAKALATAGVALSGGKDYVIVLSGKGNCDPWVAAVETAQLRKHVQDLSGGCLPAVIHKATAPAAVTVMATSDGSLGEGEVLCSGASFAEVQARLCGSAAAAVEPCKPCTNEASPEPCKPCADEVPAQTPPIALEEPSEVKAGPSAEDVAAPPPAAPAPETPTHAVPTTVIDSKTPAPTTVKDPEETISKEEPSMSSAGTSSEPMPAQEPTAAPGGWRPFRWLRRLFGGKSDSSQQ